MSERPRCFHCGSPRVTWHHVIPRQRIRSSFPHGAYRLAAGAPWQATPRTGVPLEPYEVRSLRQLIKDKRNRVWACARDHGQVEQRKLRCPVPESVWEFAAEFGLEWSLESDERKAVR